AEDGIRVRNVTGVQTCALPIFDVALFDIQMPGMSGLDALQRLRSDGSALPCLFVTTFGEDDYIAEAIRLDADGFVLKSGDPRQLIAGVHAVAGRGAFFSP